MAISTDTDEIIERLTTENAEYEAKIKELEHKLDAATKELEYWSLLFPSLSCLCHCVFHFNVHCM
jgi:hypothetical protein